MTKSPPHPKLLLALSLASLGAVLVGGPELLSRYGLIGALRPNAWVILGIAYVGILIKSTIGFLIKAEFRWDKFAYDMSCLVMGGILTCLAIQLTSAEDHFPGLNAVANLSIMFAQNVPVSVQHAFVLLVLLLGAFVAMGFAAIGVRDTDAGKPSALWDLSVNFGGFALVGCYAVVLISKA